jgi:hypothetical protein
MASRHALRLCFLALSLFVAAGAQTSDGPTPLIHRDTYGDLPLEELKPRLDFIAVELLNGPDDRLFVFFYGGRTGCPGQTASRAKLWKDYLVNERGLAPARIVTRDGGHREDFTAEHYLVPRGGAEPPPLATVAASEVRWLRKNDPRCRVPSARRRRR